MALKCLLRASAKQKNRKMEVNMSVFNQALIKLLFIVLFCYLRAHPEAMIIPVSADKEMKNMYHSLRIYTIEPRTHRILLHWHIFDDLHIMIICIKQMTDDKRPNSSTIISRIECMSMINYLVSHFVVERPSVVSVLHHHL